MSKEALKKVFIWTVMFIFILNGKAYVADEAQPEIKSGFSSLPDRNFTGLFAGDEGILQQILTGFLPEEIKK